MAANGINCKWPARKDGLRYKFEDKYEKIRELVLINNRGVLMVPAKKKYEILLT